MTDPPVVGAAVSLVSRRFRAPLVIGARTSSPRSPSKTKGLTNPGGVGVLACWSGSIFSGPIPIVAIGDDAPPARREGRASGRLRVIPNWVDPKEDDTTGAGTTPGRRRGLVGKFVVMLSGNVGHAQDLDSLVRAAGCLRDLDAFEVVSSGWGPATPRGRARGGCGVDKGGTLPTGHATRCPALFSAPTSTTSGWPGAGRLRRPEPALRRCCRPAGRSSSGRRGERKRAVVAEVECRIVVPPGYPSCSRATIRDAHDSKSSPRRDGRARPRAGRTRSRTSFVALGRYRDLLFDLSWVAPLAAADHGRASAVVAGWNTYRYPSGGGYDVRQHPTC